MHLDMQLGHGRPPMLRQDDDRLVWPGRTKAVCARRGVATGAWSTGPVTRFRTAASAVRTLLIVLAPLVVISVLVLLCARGLLCSLLPLLGLLHILILELCSSAFVSSADDIRTEAHLF